MALKSLLLIVICIIVAFVHQVSAQTINWDNISTQHPHLLYNIDDIAVYQQRISADADTKTLYNQILGRSRNRSDVQRQRAIIAKSGAFVLAISMNEDGGLLSEGEISELFSMYNEYMHSIDPTVQSNNSEYQWRSIELIQFCEAYDFHRGLSYPADTTIENVLADFADGMHRELTFPLQLYNNLSMKLAAAMGMAAITLQGSTNPHINARSKLWLTTALDFIEKTMFEYHSTLGGAAGYSEGPYYLRYAMMSLLPFFEALDRLIGDNTLIVDSSQYKSPLRDERYHRVFEWIAKIRMPDGRLPAFEDTYMNTRFPELSILGTVPPMNPLFAWSNYTGLTPLAASQRYPQLAETYDFRIEYLCAGAEEKDTPDHTPLTSFLPDAGYSVYRSSWDADATYFAMIGKHALARSGKSSFGSGHKHANETGFIFYADGELLVMEPGYYQYSYRDSLIFGGNHNIVLVDGKGPDRVSLLNFLVGVDAFITDTLSAEWGSVSTVTTSYENTDIARTALFFTNRYMIIRDIVQSDTEHEFTHQLHGNGLLSQGTYIEKYDIGAATWNVNAVNLHANVSCVDATPTYTTHTKKHAPSYRVFEDHSAMYSSVSAESATFHTILAPAASSTLVSFNQVPAQGAHATSCSVGSDIFMSALKTGAEMFSVTTVLGNVESDASFAVLGADESTEVSIFLEKATSLNINTLPIFTSNAQANVIAHLGSNDVDICIQGEQLQEFWLYLTFEPDTVIGTGFSSATLEGNRLHVVLERSRADMKIVLSGNPTGVTKPDQLANLSIESVYPHPVPGNSQSFQVSFTNARNEIVNIELYDLLGRKLIRRSVHSIPGLNIASLAIPSSASGIYILKLVSALNTTQRSVLVH